MKDLAPDLLSPAAHEHDGSPYSRIIERRFFRDRQIAAKWTSRDYAIHFVRSHLLSGWTEQSILEMDGCSSHIYASVCHGPTSAGIPRGKLKVKMWNRPTEFFSTREILEEVKKRRAQRSLF